MLARLATERHAREQAAADLRALRIQAAVAGLVHGGAGGRAGFERVENALLEMLSSETLKTETLKTETGRRRRENKR